MPLFPVPPVLKPRRPFNKWRELNPEAFPPPRPPTEAELRREQELLWKAWFLRWGWVVATMVMALGYALLALVLSGEGGRIGLVAP